MSALRILVTAVALLAVVDPAFAQEAAASEATGTLFSNGFTAGLCIAIAVYGGALAQSRAATSALEAIGRNPGAAGQLFTPMILGLVLIESLVIYALVIAAKLAGLF